MWRVKFRDLFARKGLRLGVGVNGRHPKLVSSPDIDFMELMSRFAFTTIRAGPNHRVHSIGIRIDHRSAQDAPENIHSPHVNVGPVRESRGWSKLRLYRRAQMSR